MHSIQIRERTNKAGTLSLEIPLGQPDTEFDVLVVVQPKAFGNGMPTPTQAPDPWAAIDAFRERLAASGRDFGDSVQDIREDRDR